MRAASFAEAVTSNHAGWRELRTRRVTRRRVVSAGWASERLKPRPAAAGSVAELGGSRPEIDAGGSSRGRISPLAGEGGPSPGPDGGEAELARDLSRRECLELDDAEPRPCGQPHAPADTVQCDAGIPTVVRLRTARRSWKRMYTLPRPHPSACSPGAGKYSSRTIVANCATARHQRPAVPVVAAACEIRSCGWAPRAASPCTSARTLARYRAFRGRHGVARWAPKSSLRAMTGVEQPVTRTASSQTLAIAAGMEWAAAGLAGVPTARGSDIAQKESCAPRRRASAAGASCASATASPGRKKRRLNGTHLSP